MFDPDAAVEFLIGRLGRNRWTAIVLGSGLSAAVEGIGDPVALPYADIPGMVCGGVEGHPQRLVAGVLAGVPVLCFCGRAHYYEGHSMDAVTLPVRLAAGLGATRIILTNSSGSLRVEIKPGCFLVIRDHLHLMGENPLHGVVGFTPMTGAYDADLRNLALLRAKELGMEATDGVYVGVSGPSYETAVEAEAYRRLGGDVIGMSTTPEAIVARNLGLKVLGLSAVTNYAAREGEDHDTVLARAGAMGAKFGEWLRAIVGGMA